MAEWQVQEIVTLDSTDIQEEIQVVSKPAPKKRHLRNKSQCFVGVFKKSIKPLEIPAATVASASQTKVPQDSEGSWRLRILRIFEAERFRYHLFALPFLPS